MVDDLVSAGQNPALRKVLFQLGSGQKPDLAAAAAASSSTFHSASAGAASSAEQIDASQDIKDDTARTQTDENTANLASQGNNQTISQPAPQRQPWATRVQQSGVGGTSFREHLERSQVQLQQPPPNSHSNMQAQGQQGQQSQPQGGPLDSVTLGQLRHLIVTDKPKSRQYDFPIDADADNMQNEIDEFYSYVEVPQNSREQSCLGRVVLYARSSS